MPRWQTWDCLAPPVVAAAVAAVVVEVDALARQGSKMAKHEPVNLDFETPLSRQDH